MENNNVEQYAFAMLEENSTFVQYGLTKREYFAGLALQGILAKDDVRGLETDTRNKCKSAIIMADELLKQLSQVSV